MSKLSKYITYISVIAAFAVMFFLQSDITTMMNAPITRVETGFFDKHNVSSFKLREVENLKLRYLTDRKTTIGAYNKKWKVIVFGLVMGNTINKTYDKKFVQNETLFLKAMKSWMVSIPNSELWFVRMDAPEIGEWGTYGFYEECIETAKDKCFDRFFHSYSDSDPRSGLTVEERDGFRLSKAFGYGKERTSNLPLIALVSPKGITYGVWGGNSGTIIAPHIYTKTVSILKKEGVNATISDSYKESLSVTYPSFIEWLTGSSNKQTISKWFGFKE